MADERDESPEGAITQQIARLNLDRDPSLGDRDQESSVAWGPKAIGLGILAIAIMVIALLLIIQGVYEVRPQ